jgi:tRNA G18 (ribose-2'-O)-methylase SpoU
MIVPVTAAGDPRLAPYRTLKDNEVARDTDGFIVEGAIALERLVDTGRFPLVSVFVSERAAERLQELLARIGAGTPILVAPQPTMDEVVGYHIHRGVLALARRLPGTSAAQLLAQHADAPLTVLVLIGLSNHDNVGACFRNAAALGADAILLDQSSCDPLYRKAIRVSSGAALSLPFAHGGTGEELIALLQARQIECWAMTPSGADGLAGITPPARLALVLGPEGPGLPEGLMQHCRRVSIPMAGGMDSLNVATAGAIALAHVASSRAG